MSRLCEARLDLDAAKLEQKSRVEAIRELHPEIPAETIEDVLDAIWLITGKEV
ncbi:MAG: hypothetical protein KDD97_10645 [Rhodobacteraceae bacterium]|nr:hypothetical protein [uncultured Defluviimonas sp.]MCB2126036.1 hypothetical protein [Paracoccaceae bacterium]